MFSLVKFASNVGAKWHLHVYDALKFGGLILNLELRSTHSQKLITAPSANLDTNSTTLRYIAFHCITFHFYISFTLH